MVLQFLLDTQKAIVIQIQYLLIERLDKYMKADETVLFSTGILNLLFYYF